MKKITERAVIARINRKLAKEDQQLKVCREDSRAFLDLGRYHIIDSRRNAILGYNLELKELATELEVLKPYEEIEF